MGSDRYTQSAASIVVADVARCLQSNALTVTVGAVALLFDLRLQCAPGWTCSSITYLHILRVESWPAICCRALSAWYNEQQKWGKLVKRVMDQDWSWANPALDYIELYYKALRG